MSQKGPPSPQTIGGVSEGGHFTQDSGLEKVQHYVSAILLRRSRLTIDGPPENSADLERGPGPRSIADEVSGGPSIVSKLASILSEIALRL